MSNTYHMYKEAVQLLHQYKDVFDTIADEEGVLDEELQIKLLEVESNYEILANDTINMINYLDNEIQRRDNEVERLQSKSKRDANGIKFLKEFLAIIIKSRNTVNKGGNPEFKAGDYNLSVSKTKSLNVDKERFVDKRFLSYKLNNKLSPITQQHLATYFTKVGKEVEFEKVIDANAVKKAIDKGEEIVGASIVEKDKLSIK